MAILSQTQLATLRRLFVAKLGDAPVDFDKPTINAALQAIEDWFEANRVAISGVINTATTPYVFTGPQKVLLVAYWLLRKAFREGA